MNSNTATLPEATALQTDGTPCLQYTIALDAIDMHMLDQGPDGIPGEYHDLTRQMHLKILLAAAGAELAELKASPGRLDGTLLVRRDWAKLEEMQEGIDMVLHCMVMLRDGQRMLQEAGLKRAPGSTELICENLKMSITLFERLAEIVFNGADMLQAASLDVAMASGIIGLPATMSDPE